MLFFHVISPLIMKWDYAIEITRLRRSLLVSTYAVCERLLWCTSRFLAWTVNFGPNFPESPFLELKTRKPLPPPFQKTSDLGWPKFTPEYPPPPILENFRFGMTKVYSGIPPILENFRFGMTKVYSGIPPPQWKLWESPSLRVSEYRELLHVETLSSPDNYSLSHS